MAKKNSTSTIESKIKRLNYLYATNGSREEIDNLKADIDYFEYGILKYKKNG